MKKLMILALCLVLTVLSGCSALNTAAPKATEAPVAQQQADSAQTASGANPVATIEIENFGKIVVELYPDVAPITVENFVNLAKEGFYDGLTFHRIISGFMIQGGCPQGTGTGGPGHTIKGEFALNGIKNDLSHTRGVISMARANDPDSAGSQFFIVHQDSTFLDGQYAAFGKVIEGLDVVDAVASTPTYASDKPKKKVVIKTITIA
ncbi:MAG: peptidylprolyl isomerase [Clostridiales bacterium]|nr:peptidylprolyl isomerase [Clostridiales bacterium]